MKNIDENEKELGDNPVGRSCFLMSGLSWQESLLQAYRNYMIVSQSILIAMAHALLHAQLTATSLVNILPFTIPFFIISTLGLVTLYLLRTATLERSKAVDWWQRRLAQHEAMNATTDWDFSTFRVAKESSFSDYSGEAHSLKPEQIGTLLRPGKPKARKVFDYIVSGFYLLWGVVVISSLYNFPWNDFFQYISS